MGVWALIGGGKERGPKGAYYRDFLSSIGKIFPYRGKYFPIGKYFSIGIKKA